MAPARWSDYDRHMYLSAVVETAPWSQGALRCFPAIRANAKLASRRNGSTTTCGEGIEGLAARPSRERCLGPRVPGAAEIASLVCRGWRR